MTEVAKISPDPNRVERPKHMASGGMANLEKKGNRLFERLAKSITADTLNPS